MHTDPHGPDAVDARSDSLRRLEQVPTDQIVTLIQTIQQIQATGWNMRDLHAEMHRRMLKEAL